MIITQKQLSDLTLNTIYPVKFAMLQRIPYYISVTSTADSVGNVSVNYYTDSTGATLDHTQTQPATQSVWIIDITQ